MCMLFITHVFVYVYIGFIFVCVSSNINEVIRTISNLFFFFIYEKILHAQKAQKAQKVQKAQKAQNANKRLSLRRFIRA